MQKILRAPELSATSRSGLNLDHTPIAFSTTAWRVQRLSRGERPAGHDTNRVTNLGLVGLVVRLVAQAFADVLAITRVLVAALHLDDDGLLHFGRRQRSR